MKRFFALTVVVICLMLISASSMAYDGLVTDDKAVIRAEGYVSARATFVYLNASDVYDIDGKKQSLDNDATQYRIPIVGRYGIIQDLEVFAIVPFVSTDDGNTTEAGIGDVWLGAKYSVLSENLLTLRAALDVPAGDDKKGLGNPGGFGVDFGVLSQKILGKVMLDGQVGVRWNGEDSDTKWTPGPGIYVDGEAAYNFTEVFRAQVGLEYFNFGDGELNGKSASDTMSDWLDINVGARYRFTESKAVRADLISSLTGTNTNVNMGVMISFVSIFDF